MDFEDPEGTRLKISDDLSEEQIEKLGDFDGDALKGGQIMWDPKDKEWYDPQRKYGTE